jgi:hypothetical protein
MPNTQTLAAAVVVLSMLGVAPGPRAATGASTLTAEDRAEIQQLMSRYARALGTCAAEDYASLFAEPDGYFASGPRGQVQGRKKLIELVKSEPHCWGANGGAAGSGNARGGDGREGRAFNGPTVTVEPSGAGASGITVSGNNGAGGHYEDVYVKTPQGWRFQSRTFISPQEAAAHHTAQDYIEIRRLADSKGGPYEDVYTDTPEGRRFRSAGVVIAPAADGGATGRAYVLNGGHYEDVYVKTQNGWRLGSRTYVEK